jgi:hypothetical protein
LGCSIIIFDEKKMPVIMIYFIGRWSRVVNGKLPEDRSQRSEVRGQRSEVRGQRTENRDKRSEVRGLRISNAFFVLNLER